LSKIYSSFYILYVDLVLLRKCQADGIWAWDCIENEPVLIVPSVFALLGDNPMQSEFACHIGLKGKLFCRACWVKGSDAVAESEQEESDSRREDHDGSDNEPSENGSVAGSDAAVETDNEAGNEQASDVASASGKKGKGRRKKALESMASMVNRAKAFIKVRNTYI
jgi:hypothetical protein